MIALVLATVLAAESIAVGQIRACATLLGVFQRSAEPTIADLHASFGGDNDGELDAFALVQCHNKCDAPIDSACAAQFDARLARAGTASSILLVSAKRYLHSHGFLTGQMWIEWPSRAAPDQMRHIRVKTQSGTLVFEFLARSKEIEQIYLPDGRDVFSAALPTCNHAAPVRQSASSNKAK
jgi:hypothetical protein